MRASCARGKQDGISWGGLRLRHLQSAGIFSARAVRNGICFMTYSYWQFTKTVDHIFLRCAPDGLAPA
jgi:hypothetical protein